MSVSYNYVNLQTIANWLHRALQETNLTPEQYWNLDNPYPILDFLLSYEINGNVIVGHYAGGETLRATYDPHSLDVSRIEEYIDGNLAYLWEGTVSFENFLNLNWQAQVMYGHPGDDFISVDDTGPIPGGVTVYAGDGNDVISVWSGSQTPVKVFGGAGADTFTFSSPLAEVTLADYQAGEKLFFEDFANLNELLAHVVGVDPLPTGGFSVTFSTDSPGETWKLTFENFSLANLRLDDLIFGPEGALQIYGPLLEVLGVSTVDPGAQAMFL